MQIAMIFGIFPPTPINFDELWTSPRGLTGSEMAFVCFARELKKLGHDVTLYVKDERNYDWEVPVRRLQEMSDEQEVAISFMNPDMLRVFPKDKTLRVCNQQVNDFHYCTKEFDQFVDLYTSPSLPHKDMITRQHGLDPDKWIVLHNGVYPEDYPQPAKKVRGRVIYASSPDRGLHHLLACWPTIRELAPHATLRIFYDVHGFVEKITRLPESIRRNSPIHAEWYRRGVEIQTLLGELEGVEAIGSVDRQRIRQEMLEAEVMAYPCDPVTWTEGFSVATLEACAAGTIPVITSADALGQVYGGHVPMVFMPIKWQLDTYAKAVARTLNADEMYRNAMAARGRKLAEHYAWPKLALHLERQLTAALLNKHKQ